MRRINGEQIPEVALLKQHKNELLKDIVNAMRLLTPYDFELLVELIFSTSGWRRVGATGGNQKTVDLEIMLPSTNERALVQVKSDARNSVFETYAAEFARRGEDKMFYAYHTAPKSLETADKGITLLGPEKLAEMVLNAGLVEWLTDRVS